MRSSLLLLFLLSAGCPAFSQKDSLKACLYAMDKSAVSRSCVENIASKRDSEAEATVRKLLMPLGLTAKYLLRECSEIQTFAAVVSAKTNGRYILYNPAMIDSISDPMRKNWDTKAIYFHEMAHHLNGNTCNPDDTAYFQNELDADRFSGVQIAMLGASLRQAQHALTIIPSPPCDRDSLYSHPCILKRLNKVADGWYFGKGLEVFYNSIVGKGFADSASSFDIRSDNLFEERVCVRGFGYGNCRIKLKKVRFSINANKELSTLSMDLFDSGDRISKVFHHIDTTLTFSQNLTDASQVLPNSNFMITFFLPGYGESVVFKGRFESQGKLSGILYVPAPNTGASWSAAAGEVLGDNILARFNMFPK